MSDQRRAVYAAANKALHLNSSLLLLFVVLAAVPTPSAQAQTTQPPAPNAPTQAAPTRVVPTQATPRALREMQIHKVPELGLTIWTENQPTWEAELSQITGRPSFIVQSPDSYHPPAVMTYSSWPQEKVPAEQFTTMAQTAIQRASQNFGLDLGQARSIKMQPVTYGVLQGLEGNFVGRVEGVAMDVKVFIGQQPGQFPVALNVYTLKGKMVHLTDVLRRAWTKLGYL